jgi:hypothetical protein
MTDEKRKSNEKRPDDEPTIHVDSDWKEEAQREKQRLAEADRENREVGSRGEGKRAPLPPASFAHFLLSLSTQAMIALGDIENPVTGKTERDLEQARFTIDLLEILQEKTEGNRTDEESRTLETLLYDLRMRYVAASRDEA